MNVQTTIEQLKKLKLHGMVRAYEAAISATLHETDWQEMHTE